MMRHGTNKNSLWVPWMILAGTGIDALFFTLDLRYEYTFNSLLKDSPDYSYNTHNQFIIVSLGFKLVGNK